MTGRRLVSRCRLLVALLLAGALPYAQADELLVYFDLDGSAATGCSVTTVDGAFDGVEQVLITRHANSQVTEVVRQECTTPATDTFGPEISVSPAGWPVGLGLGTSGSDVVETFVSRADLGAAAPTSLVAFATRDATGADADAILGPDAGGLLLQGVGLPSTVAIPSLQQFGLVLLALMLAAVSLRGLRRHQGLRSFVMVVLLAGSLVGLVWAAIIADGDPSDWDGIAPLDTDPFGDGGGSDAVAVFGRSEGSQLNFRADVFGVNDPPVLSPDTFSPTYIEGGAAVPIADAITVSDPDDTQLASATITITNPQAGAAEMLAADTTGTAVVATYTAPVLTLTGADSLAKYQMVLRSVTYQNSSAALIPARTIDLVVNDGDLVSNTATSTISIVTVNDPPVAQDDAVSTDEDTVLNGNVMADNGNGADSDPDSAFQVTLVNGSAANVGVQITLLSGALLTLNTDGTFIYDPNGQFDALTVGDTATDSFTYQICDPEPLCSSATVTVTISGVNDAPVAADHSFDTVGNTLLEAGIVPASTAPKVTTNGRLTDGATDPDNTLPTELVASLVGATAGAVVHVNPDGTFDYLPPPGRTTDDTFTYTLCNAGDAVHCDTGTVTVQFTDIVWYVNNDPPAPVGSPNGTSVAPFADLSPLKGAGSPDGVGHTIFVHSGNAAYSAGIDLADNQKLIGQGTGLTVGALLSIPLGPRPTLTATAAATNAVDLRVGNTVRGLNIGDTTGMAFKDLMVNVGTLTIDNVAVFGTGGAINIADGGTLAVTFDSLSTTNHSGAFISLGTGTGVGGSLTVSNTDAGVDTGASGVTQGIDIRNAPAGSSFSFGETTIASSGTGVNLAANPGASFSFADLDIVTTAGAGLVANNSGTVNISGTGNTVTATGSPALDVIATSAGSGWTFSSLNSSGSATTGVNLDAVSGNVIIGASGSSISGATGTAFRVNSGPATVSYGGSITNTAGRSVEITNSGGTTANVLTFSGLVDDNGTGIFLDNNDQNSGATINFSGGLVLETGANTGFTATNGGTVNVTGATNTIGAATALTTTAVNIANTTIGASGVTFRSIRVNGAANGIVLNNAGTGGFTITGDDATGPDITANNDSGGSILNTTGDGIVLTDVSNVLLDQLRIQDAAGHGINGTRVNGLTVTRANLVSNGNANQEHGLRLLNPAGNVTVTNTLADSNFDAHLRVLSETGNNLTLFRVDDSVFQNVTTGFFEDGISFESQTGVTTAISVTNSLFLNHDGDHIQASSNGSTTMTVILSNNDMDGAAGNLGAGMTTNSAGNFSGDTDFTIAGNDLQKANNSSTSIAINIGSSTNAGTYDGTISGNTVGTQGIANSGGNQGTDTEVNQDATMTVAIDGNLDIREFFDVGINIGAVDGSGTNNATVTGNMVTNSTDINVFSALFVDAQTNNTVCLDAGGLGVENTFSTFPQNSFLDVGLQAGGASGTINLEGYGGTANSTAQVESYIQGRNNGSPVVLLNLSGSGTVQGGGDCPTPP